MMVNRENTYALVISIEKYQLGREYNTLKTPVRDACAFAEWLCQQAVPPEHIFLLLSPLPQNEVWPTSNGLVPQLATQEKINETIELLSEKEDGELLYVFWEGHGFINEDHKRMLYYPEANKKKRSHFDLESLLTSLRSNYFRSFLHQICIIHACARSQENWDVVFPSKPYCVSIGKDPRDCEQLAIFSSSVGYPAWTGSFFYDVMDELKNASRDDCWPPNREEVLQGLDKRHVSIHLQGSDQPGCAYRWYRPLDKDERPALAKRTPSQELSIFVSYSSTLGDQAKEVLLERLYSALGDVGFITLPTKDWLIQSDTWKKDLFFWMQQCQSAVVLCSEDALQSDRFRFEDMILNWRKCLKPEFPIHHIFLPSTETYQEDRGEMVQKIIRQLITFKTQLVRRPIPSSLLSPIQDLESVMTPWIKKLDNSILLRAAQVLSIDTSAWPKSAKFYGALLAHELLKAEFSEASKALKVLSPHLDKDIAFRILTILAPSWIDVQAIAPIPEIVKHPQEHWSICTNGTIAFTGETYIRRACSSFPSWETISISTIGIGEDLFGGIIGKIRESVRKVTLANDLSNDSIDALLNVSENDNPYVVIILGDVGNDILTRLKSMYLGVTFFLLSGDTILDQQALDDQYIKFLHPRLDREREIMAFSQYYHARKIVESINSA